PVSDSASSTSFSLRKKACGTESVNHQRLINHRNTLLAHNDLTPHREVVAFSSAGILKRPLVTEGRSPINRKGITEVRELFKVQAERMDPALLELTERLEKLEHWDPDTQRSGSHRRRLGPYWAPPEGGVQLGGRG